MVEPKSAYAEYLKQAHGHRDENDSEWAAKQHERKKRQEEEEIRARIDAEMLKGETARQRMSNVCGVLPSRVQKLDDSKKKQEHPSLLDIPGVGKPVKDTLSELQFAARAAKASSSGSDSDSDASSEGEGKKKKKRKKKHKSKRKRDSDSSSDSEPKKKKRKKDSKKESKKKKSRKDKKQKKQKEKKMKAEPVQLSQFLAGQNDSSSDSDPGAMRSAISGKKIKMKLDHSKEDKLRAKNQSQLLRFLNSTYDD